MEFACGLAAGCLVLFQAALVFGYVRAVRRPPPEGAADPLPRTLVILCARGEDPSLAACLRSLEGQRGIRLEFAMVTDHADDPAVVAWQRQRDSRVDSRIQHVVAPLLYDSCSLKCQSLAFAVETLGDDFEYLITLDGDSVPGPFWARQLIASAVDQRAAAAFGNRWFHPPAGSVGGWMRYLWNAAAIVQMHHYRIPWGGSLAIQMAAVRAAGLVDLWRHAMFEDVLVADALAAHGNRVNPVAPVFLLNGESTSLRSAVRWIVRQLLDVRLYHRGWPLVVAHALAAAGIPWLLLGLAVARGLSVGMVASLSPLGIWMVLQLANVGLLAWISRNVEHAIRRQDAAARSPGLPGELVGRISHGWRWWVRVFLLVPVAQLLHAGAVLRAAVARRTVWRGIRYEVDGPWAVRRREYTRYSN